MHVEFRCCYAERACAFTPLSFYRVKEQMLLESKVVEEEKTARSTSFHGPQMQERKSAFSYLSTRGRTEDDLPYTPKFQVQFVLERAIEFSTAAVKATKNTKGTPLQKKKGKTMLLDTETYIKTNTYSVFFWDAQLASLPLKACNGSLKIRLVQLPPPLRTKEAQSVVAKALSGARYAEHRMDTPLCIGVAKFTLYELLSLRGGVRVALQAKKGLISIVEGLNLNSTSQNTLLGGKVGGSAFLLFEVVAFTYGRASLFKLLYSSSEDASNGRIRGESVSSIGSGERTADDPLLLQDNNAVDRCPSLCGSIDEQALEDSHLPSCYQKNTSEAALSHFLVVPYLAAVGVVININDVLSWTRLERTFALMGMCVLAYMRELEPVFVGLCGLYMSCSYAFYLLQFYNQTLHRLSLSQISSGLRSKKGGFRHVSISLEQRGTKFYEHNHFSSLTPGKPMILKTCYLYGRQNKLLNAFVRSLYFNQVGRTENSFYEIAFAVSLLRARKYKILITIGIVFLFLMVLPLDSFFVLLCVGVFAIYPITVRFTVPRSAKSRKRCLLNTKYLRRTWCLNRPLRILYPPCSALMGDSESQFRKDEREVLTPLKIQNSAFYSRHPLDQQAIMSSRISSFSPHGTRQVSLNTTRLTFAVLSLTNLSSGKLGGSWLLDQLLAHSDRVKAQHSVNSGFLFTRGRSQTFSSNILSPRARMGAGSTALGGNGGGSRAAPTYSGYEKYMQDTLDLFLSLRTQVLLTVHVSTTANMDVISNTRKRLDSLIQPQWLLEQGEDDSITSTLSAMTTCPFTVAQLEKRDAGDYKPEVRALAALAAYLLQGARLSIYSRGYMNRNCSIILPLAVGSSGFVRYNSPFIRPFEDILNPLLNTLEKIWRNESFTFSSFSSCLPPTSNVNTGGKALHTLQGNSVLDVSVEMVLQLIRCAHTEICGHLNKRPASAELVSYLRSKDERGDHPHT